MADELDNKVRAYGITHKELRDIQESQSHGTVEMIEANNADNINDDYFKKDFPNGYKIPYHEASHYHVALEARLFHQQTGQRLTNSKVQVFSVVEWKELMNTKPNNMLAGYNVHILHDPTREPSLKKEPVKTVSLSTGIPELDSLKDVKQAKAYYEKSTGKKATRVWTFEKTIEAIKTELGLNIK